MSETDADEAPEWKSLSKRQLQLQNQQLKAMTAQLHDHLGQLGQFMEQALMGHFQILKFCHKQIEALKLSPLSLGPRQIQEVMDTLRVACQMAMGFAVEWRKMQDPDFDPAGIIDMNSLLSPEGLKGYDHVEASCSACDWTGFKTELTPQLRCPMCDEMVILKVSEEAGDGEAAQS